MAAEKKKFPLVFVLLPLVAVLGVAAFFGFNLYREYARSEAEDQETARQIAAVQAEKAKAARLAADVPKVEKPVVEDDDLGNLPKGTVKKPVKAVNANHNPAQKAYYGFKAAYEKLESTNENAARKFRVRKLQLDDQFSNGNPTNEPKFVAECDSARTQILEALRNPENQ